MQPLRFQYPPLLAKDTFQEILKPYPMAVCTGDVQLDDTTGFGRCVGILYRVLRSWAKTPGNRGFRPEIAEKDLTVNFVGYLRTNHNLMFIFIYNYMARFVRCFLNTTEPANTFYLSAALVLAGILEFEERAIRNAQEVIIFFDEGGMK